MINICLRSMCTTTFLFFHSNMFIKEKANGCIYKQTVGEECPSTCIASGTLCLDSYWVFWISINQISSLVDIVTTSTNYMDATHCKGREAIYCKNVKDCK